MRVQYNFSSRKTGQARDPKNYLKKKKKFPEVAQIVLDSSDIIVQVLDARFPDDTRNHALETYVHATKKKLLHVLTKADLCLRKQKIQYAEPTLAVSAKQRSGVKKLRDKIKELASTIHKKDKVTVGVLGYPNVGKSTLINLLVGKKSAPVGAEGGFTKGLQKLKLTKEIVIFDSPGVIPRDEYSTNEQAKLTKHAKVGSKTFAQVKNPEQIVADLMGEFATVLEKHYAITANADAEVLLETLGKKLQYFKKGGVVDIDKTARKVLRDFQEGRIRV